MAKFISFPKGSGLREPNGKVHKGVCPHLVRGSGPTKSIAMDPLERDIDNR